MCQPAFDRVGAGHREGDGEAGRQLQWLRRPTPHVARARRHDRGWRNAGVAPARIRSRRRYRGGAGRGCSFRRVLRRSADRQLLSSAAGRRRAQRRLRASVVAHQGDPGRGRRLRILPAGFGRNAARGRRAGGVGLLFAPAIIDLLAPGFDRERHALAADYFRIAAPYVALAGVVAVVAAVLNAQGRVVAVALGIAAFNAVLLAVLAWIAAFGGAPPS